MKGITPRQRELLSYIAEFIRNHGHSPSYREIMAHFQYSSLGTVHKHVQGLKRKGLLTTDTGKRTLMPTTASHVQTRFSSEINVPFIGTIAAGVPIETFPHSKTLAVPEFLVHTPDKTYILQAKGNTLTEELIVDGDYLIVEARQEAQAGDTVVALINMHDTVVKRYYPEGSFACLAGHNPHHKPILLRHTDLLIHGVVIGLFRLFQ